MSWQIEITTWMFSTATYAFIALILLSVLKQSLKEVVTFYFAEKAKWIEQLEKKLGGKGGSYGSALH